MDVLEKQKALNEFKESIKEKTLDELKALEQEIIKEANENDEKLKTKEFELPQNGYNAVAEAIRMLLDRKCEVAWQYSLGLVSMYDFWNPQVKPKVVVYPMLDGTLRTLGEMRFKGYDEWAAVVAINKYFEPIRPLYVEASESMYDIAMRHDAVMNQMKLLEPVNSEIPDQIKVE